MAAIHAKGDRLKDHAGLDHLADLTLRELGFGSSEYPFASKVMTAGSDSGIAVSGLVSAGAHNMSRIVEKLICTT